MLLRAMKKMVMTLQMTTTGLMKKKNNYNVFI
jgi:hypothetical protein